MAIGNPEVEVDGVADLVGSMEAGDKVVARPADSRTTAREINAVNVAAMDPNVHGMVVD